MGVVDAVREAFRDHARDNICAGLKSLGVNAQMAVRGRPEEDTGKGSLGIIDIDDGPIPWVNVRKVTRGGGQYGGGTDYYTDYRVNVPYRPPNATIRSDRRKSFLRAKVIGAHWSSTGSEGDSGLVADVLRRLGEEAYVRAAIVATRDVEIIGSGVGWIISTQTREAPSRQAWYCYQAIARHLIEARRTETNTE